MAEKIELFQDMAIRVSGAKRKELRAALIAATVKPWQVDLEGIARIARDAATSDDVLVFRREADKSVPAASLTLWETPDGYNVPNIVPIAHGELTIAQYNAVLKDFIERIAAPIAGDIGFTIATTSPRQSLEDWLSPDAAKKLRSFSGLANKSTGTNHPADGERWFDFLVAVHRAGDKLSSGTLARWLHDVEGWDEESAHRLAGKYETALSLLAHYDKDR
jgi:hypothetical protein